MFKPDISIIMPVYNAEKTIERSIGSVLHQSISEFEIVCVDDGSTDTSAERINALRENHPNICLLKQGHQGSGEARNVGIKAAKGNYIAFLDADDEYIDADALDIMVKACREHHVQICGSFRIESSNDGERYVELFEDYIIGKEGCLIKYSDFQHDYDYQSFIFDRNFLVENKIWFPYYMRYQDPPFLVHALSIAESFFVMPVTLYRYRFNPLKHAVIVKYIDHILLGMYDTLEIAKERGYEKLFNKVIGRIDGTFRRAILQNLSDETLTLLISINKLSWEFLGRKLDILPQIYNGISRTENLAYSNELMRKVVAIKQSGKGFRTYFETRKFRKVAVYGIGVYGKILINELLLCGIQIVCGIDQNVSEYKNIPIIRPGDDVPECDALIVSLIEPEAIVTYYEKLGNVRIFAFTQIIQTLAEEGEYG